MRLHRLEELVMEIWSQQSLSIIQNQFQDQALANILLVELNEDGTLRTEPCSYVKLNEVKDAMPLCGCKACQSAGSVKNIKDLYHMKAVDDEACYYSRQLMGLHAVRQHRKLCEVIANYSCIDEFCDAYPSKLNQGLKIIYEQL